MADDKKYVLGITGIITHSSYAKKFKNNYENRLNSANDSYIQLKDLEGCSDFVISICDKSDSVYDEFKERFPEYNGHYMIYNALEDWEKSDCDSRDRSIDDLLTERSSNFEYDPLMEDGLDHPEDDLKIKIKTVEELTKDELINRVAYIKCLGANHAGYGSKVKSINDYTEDNEFANVDFKITDKQTAIDVVSTKGRDLQFVSDELKNDKDVVTAAFKENGCAVDFIGSDIKINKDLALIGIKSNPYMYVKLSDELKSDKDVRDFTKTISRKAILSSSAHEDIEHEVFKFTEQTVENCLDHVQHCRDGLRDVKEQTPEICKAAVKWDGSNLEYVKDQTAEICISAIKDDHAYSIYGNVADHIRDTEMVKQLSVNDDQKVRNAMYARKDFEDITGMTPKRAETMYKIDQQAGKAKDNSDQQQNIIRKPGE